MLLAVLQEGLWLLVFVIALCEGNLLMSSNGPAVALKCCSVSYRKTLGFRNEHTLICMVFTQCREWRWYFPKHLPLMSSSGLPGRKDRLPCWSRVVYAVLVKLRYLLVKPVDKCSSVAGYNYLNNLII